MLSTSIPSPDICSGALKIRDEAQGAAQVSRWAGWHPGAAEAAVPLVCASLFTGAVCCHTKGKTPQREAPRSSQENPADVFLLAWLYH